MLSILILDQYKAILGHGPEPDQYPGGGPPAQREAGDALRLREPGDDSQPPRRRPADQLVRRGRDRRPGRRQEWWAAARLRVGDRDLDHPARRSPALVPGARR